MILDSSCLNSKVCYNFTDKVLKSFEMIVFLFINFVDVDDGDVLLFLEMNFLAGLSLLLIVLF